MDSVPRFFRLTLREDNFEVVPPEGDPRLIRMTPVDRWRTLHQDAYGDLVTLQVPWSVDETVRRTKALPRHPGRKTATPDPRALVKPTISSPFFAFKDDWVGRGPPNPHRDTNSHYTRVPRGRHEPPPHQPRANPRPP